MYLFSMIFLVMGLCSCKAYGFTNPIRTAYTQAPYITFYNNNYYLLMQGRQEFRIVTATTIEGLKTAADKLVWTDDTFQRNRNFWGPELHRIDGRWYLYYSAAPELSNPNPTIRTWVLQGGTRGPLDDEFTFFSYVSPPNENVPKYDPTVYSIGGKRYYMYASTNQTGAMWIAELLSPNVTGPATLFSRPTYTFEKGDYWINEAPTGLTSPKGNHYVFFNGPGLNENIYSLGIELGYLKLTPGADPLVASSWVKRPESVFTRANGVAGPGLGSFFKSPDGKEDWFVFSACGTEGGPATCSPGIYVQKLGWNADDTPNLGTPLAPGTEIDPPSGERVV